MKVRPPISRHSLPNLPWEFSHPQPIAAAFVFGVANKTWPIRDKSLPKDYPIAYKYLRWHRLSLHFKKLNEFKKQGRNYVYFTDSVGNTKTIQDFINNAIDSIRREQLLSIHSIAVIYDPHGENSIEIIPY